MSRRLIALVVCLFCSSLLAQPATKSADDAGWVKLFTEPGVPKGWNVRAWSDVSKPGPKDAAWKVDADGVLHGSNPRGTWLMSEAVYGDFIIEFDWKLGVRGNSGLGLRIPEAGDPAFDGLELQMVDPEYRPSDPETCRTAALYKAIAASEQVYKPTEWNHYQVTLRGKKITVVLNGKTVQDVDLAEHKKAIERHDGKPAPSLSERPLKGHIGFQELSRDNAHVMIRNVRLKELR